MEVKYSYIFQNIPLCIYHLTLPFLHHICVSEILCMISKNYKIFFALFLSHTYTRLHMCIHIYTWIFKRMVFRKLWKQLWSNVLYKSFHVSVKEENIEKREFEFKCLTSGGDIQHLYCYLNLLSAEKADTFNT